jgi:hypothetical protein
MITSLLHHKEEAKAATMDESCNNPVFSFSWRQKDSPWWCARVFMVCLVRVEGRNPRWWWRAYWEVLESDATIFQYMVNHLNILLRLFTSACMSGDGGRVRQLLRDESLIHRINTVTNDDGRTPLHHDSS